MEVSNDWETYCSMSAESQGALLGNGTTGASPRQPWRHATIEKLLEAAISTRSENQANSDATREHVTPRHADNSETIGCSVFCWVRAEAL
jgi:hypothetical protein